MKGDNSRVTDAGDNLGGLCVNEVAGQDGLRVWGERSTNTSIHFSSIFRLDIVIIDQKTISPTHRKNFLIVLFNFFPLKFKFLLFVFDQPIREKMMSDHFSRTCPFLI